MSWLSWLKPTDKEILNTLETQSANLLRATESLVVLIINYENVVNKKNLIKDLEHNGDAIAHNIFNTLDRTFITPLDRRIYQGSHLLSTTSLIPLMVWPIV